MQRKVLFNIDTAYMGDNALELLNVLKLEYFSVCVLMLTLLYLPTHQDLEECVGAA